ncbi:hypothetical protein CGT68_17780 [Vibrio cholerae]|uniref:hypothetical protein n=1 Tax=Vibrio cholerae TaxID=666 RepID=UPI000BA8F558|nr:hypothetical protein [Vibrio cholerae]PAS39873.1 hypothetical protein CGT68_17780 [Vibrio cholerae]PAS40350.1 hypothetical protein CGT69_14820 [Vibrio cholerae]
MKNNIQTQIDLKLLQTLSPLVKLESYKNKLNKLTTPPTKMKVVESVEILVANKPRMSLEAFNWVDSILLRLNHNKRCYELLNTLKEHKYNEEIVPLINKAIESGMIEYKDIY